MTTWWSTERINATLNREYVERELGSLKNREALHRVLRFGDGLTDDTYLDWVLERSPRFFLILNDIGCPEKIFDIIDRSFDDEDLPLSQDALWEHNLFGTRSETLDKKFYRQQYSFLVQELEPGGHVDYGVWEVVPVEPVVKRGQISNTQVVDKVFAYEHLYTRKKIPGSGEEGIDKVHFMLHLRGLAQIQHPHLVSVFTTYSQDDFNYVLLAPSAELNLKQVFEDQSKQFKLLEKKDRREIVLTWAHCIASALAYLHDHGFVHKGIRPSNVIIDQNSKVYLSDYAALRVLDCEDTTGSYNGELYDHSPPENWLRKPYLHETAPLKTYLPGGGRTSRRLPKPRSQASEMRPPPSPISSIVNRSASRSASSSGSSSTNARPRNAVITTFAPQRNSAASIITKQYPADIFSFSAVLLTLLSFLLGHSPKTFASHRCKLNRQAGRGNAPPDASFHKNLKQVENWMDKLTKQAGQKEKKDVKFWGAVVELIGVCRLGLGKDPGSRISASEMEKKVGGWVDWGLARRRRCTCHDSKEEKSETSKEDVQEISPRVVQPPKPMSERISYINQTPARYWTTVSEDVSSARNSFATGMDTPRVRRSMATQRSSFHATNGRNSFLRDSIASGTLNGLSIRRNSRAAPKERRTSEGTEVWGLGEALREEDEVGPDIEKHHEIDKYYYGDDVEDHTFKNDGGEYCLEDLAEEDEIGVIEDVDNYLDDDDDGADVDVGDDGDDEVEKEEGLPDETVRNDWPLPVGTLSFEQNNVL